MRKLMIFSLSVCLAFGAVSPAAASKSQEATEKEIQELQQEIEAIAEKIRETPEEDRAPIINEKIQKVRQKNKAAAWQQAYRMFSSDESESLSVSFTAASLAPGEQVPAEYMPHYIAAGEKYNVDWFTLAAIHKIETDFSRIGSMVSTAGALGHMQFMPGTWAAYGVDGNGDGIANTWDLEDSIHSAANYLNAMGYSTDKRKAIFAYNRAEWYVNKVLKQAEVYEKGYTLASKDVLEAGKTFINNSTYIFGGGRNQYDISRGRFDCSSFVHWAFKQTGQELGHLTSVTTDTLKKLGTQISPADMQPGDLVFFDTYKIDGHVGIYAGNGMFLGAQPSTGVAFADMSNNYWKEKFNGRVIRL